VAKNIFRDFEVKKLSGDMVLALERTFEPKATTEVIEAVPVPEGPTLEDLKNEAEEFKRQWEIEKEQLKSNVDEFRVGDTVKVHAKVKEGQRERIQIFEGTVLKRQGGGARETFTVRKLSGGVGVERTWPVHSPNVDRIEVVRHGKVRRAKLTFLRGRVGKSAKLKEV